MAFCRRFPPGEFHLDVDAADVAMREGAQFNIIHPTSGLKIDVFSDKKDEVAGARSSAVVASPLCRA